MEKLFDYLQSRQFILSICVLLVGMIVFLIEKHFDKKLSKLAKSGLQIYKTARTLLGVAHTIIQLILLLIILSVNGVQVGRMVTNLGLVGVVLSFALQDILKDVVMGVSIIFERYFQVGDVVVYNGELAKVISYNIKTTKLLLIDTDTLLSVSNRNISEIGIASDWIDIDIPIGYDIDLQVSRIICKEAAERISKIPNIKKCEFLGTNSLDESWITYKLRIHANPEIKKALRRDALSVLQDIFYEHDIPFPLEIKVIFNHQEALDTSGALKDRKDAFRRSGQLKA